MEKAETSPYWLTRFCFQRALAFIYLIAFLVTLNQVLPLVGESGLLPAKLYLQHVTFWDVPGFFWLNCSDTVLRAAALTGVVISFLAVTGLTETLGMFVSVTAWSLLWFLYLSFVSIGQAFYSFGWEILLLEAGFLAIFLGSNNTQPPKTVIWLLRWVLFRVMFGAGLIKIRGDECWRNLTCMYYHYETQPLPNPLSWYFHYLPKGVHRAGTLFTHFVELVVPFGLFGPRSLCCAAGFLTILFQVILILSGNLSWLNYLTIVLAIPCFDDHLLRRLLSIRPPCLPPACRTGRAGRRSTREMTGFRKSVLGALTISILLLSIHPALNLISSSQLMNASFEPFHLVNTYGAFGSVTRARQEIVLEGTTDKKITAETRWLEYEFKCKPGDVRRAPCVVSPYHYRLDWLMWFAAMGDYRYHGWLLNLVAKLLWLDSKALSLLERNPFPASPPTFIRAVLYTYRFTTPEERARTGAWWVRRRAREYLPPLSMDYPEFQKVLEEQKWLRPADVQPR